MARNFPGSTGLTGFTIPKNAKEQEEYRGQVRERADSFRDKILLDLREDISHNTH